METIENNKWMTRQDVVKGLLELVRPLRPYYNIESSMLKIGDTAAHYGERAAGMEGWARVLWGLGPLFATDNKDICEVLRIEIDDWKHLYRRGLVNGTDPLSPGYWGNMDDYDQKMVETAALSVALSIAGESLWKPLSAEEKIRVEAWMRQINKHRIHANNWRFFRILTNMAFARLGLKVDAKALIDDFEVIENCYVSDGWYYDGHDGQMDYYIPFAMHFYGLIWAALAPKISATLSAELGEAAKFFRKPYRMELLNRGRRFAQDYEKWFSDDGVEVPFGRSLTYRFAHAAFWPALILAEEMIGDSDVKDTYGEVLAKEIFGRVVSKEQSEKEEKEGLYKHILLSNLRSWFKYPITDKKGFLTIGYRYPNLIMSEKYNAPGSPYWSFKAFLILMFPATSGVWHAKEKALSVPAKSYLKAPHMLVCHDMIDDIDHITMFPCGQHAGMEHGNCDSKYKKLVYSNRFGFSVQRGNGLEDGAFDNVFAVSRHGENIYRMTNCLKWDADENEIRIISEPIEGVRIKTKIIPKGYGWHIRIHEIETKIAIDTADGGFALPVERPFDKNDEYGKREKCSEPVSQDRSQFIISDWGSIGVFSEDKGAETAFVRAFPNTNLMAPLTVIPYVKREYSPGKYIQVNGFYGSPTSNITLIN